MRLISIVIGFVLATAILIFTPVFLVMRRFISPVNAAIVYANGLVLKRGSKVMEQPFCTLEKIEFMPFDLSSSLYKLNTVTLVQKDGSKPINDRVPDFTNFSHALNSAFMIG